MRGQSMPFRDRAHEKAFLLEYGRVGVFVDVAAASVGLAASLLKLFLRAMLVPATSAHATGLPPSNGCVEGVRVAMSLIPLLAYAVVGRQRYTFLRGPLSVLHRAAVALGMPLTARPGLCRFCDLIWHQRLLVINTMCVLSRAPIMSYWIGGMLASTLAVLVDAADPSGSCKHSYSCLLSSLTDLACSSSLRHPLLLLEHLCQPPLVVHAATYAAGLLVPGVALSFLEYRARKAWLQCQEQQQQRLQQVTPAAAAPQWKPSSSVAANVHTTQQQQHPSEQQPTQAQHQGQQKADPALQPQSPTASSSSSSVGVDVNNSQLSSPRNPLLYSSPNMTCVVSVNYGNLTAAAHNSSRSCSTTVTPAVALPSVVAATAAAAAPAGAFSQQDMYRSPVECYMCSFKFKPPPGTGPDHLQQFKQQLRQNLEAELRSRFMSHAATAAPAGDNGSGAEVSPLPVGPLVTQCTAFPGCYQLVFQVMVPISAVSAAAGPSSSVWSNQEQGWDLQLLARQFLQRWPGWQLLCVQAQLQLAGGAAGSSVKGQEAVPFFDGTTKPDARSLFPAPAAGAAMVLPTITLQRYVLSLSSESATSAHLLVQRCLVQQLQHRGHQHVRVVVSRQPTGIIISDQDYQLQQWDFDPCSTPQRPFSDSIAADPATRTDVGHYCHMDLDMAGIAESCSKDLQQCQAFTVVVLAGRHPDEPHADNEGLHSNSPGSVSSPGAVTPGRTGSSVAPAMQGAPAQIQQCGVLAQLPLLVLPPSVEKEFAWLLGRLQQLDIGAVCAQHMLLPIITSLAAVLSSVRAHEAPGNAVEFVPGSPGILHGVLVVALLSWFKKFNMVECASLLQSVVQQSEAVVPGGSGDPGTAMTTWCEQRANKTPELGPTACGTGEQFSDKDSTAWLGSLADATDVAFSRLELASCSVAGRFASCEAHSLGGRLASSEVQSEALNVLISLQPHVHAALGLVYY